ncbi:MAG: DUF7312 domain-containing protein [Halodesulfurarchaeum sp.]
MSDWKFDLDEVGPEAEPETPSIEPGSPAAENVIPFLLGAAMAIGMLVAAL